MDVVFAWVTAFADNTPYLSALLFALAFLNVFAPPVPIETIGVFAGYLSEAGHGNPYAMWLSISAGMATGSTILYLLARSKGRRLLRVPFVQRRMTPGRLSRAEAWFRRYGTWTILLGKLVPGMSFVTVVSSGLFGVEKQQALTVIYLANLCYFAGAVALGRVMGEEWRGATGWARRWWPYILAIVLAVVVIYALVVLRRRRATGDGSAR